MRQFVPQWGNLKIIKTTIVQILLDLNVGIQFWQTLLTTLWTKNRKTMLQSIVLDRREKNLLKGVCTTFQADIFPWILFLFYSVIQNKKCTGTTLKKDNPRSWVSIFNDCQVSLLYGGIFDAHSPSVLPGSVEWAGELKSLVSSPAGKEKNRVTGLLTAESKVYCQRYV